MGENAKSKAAIVWGASPAGASHADGMTPGSREYFERVLARRNEHEIPSVLEMIPFAAFREKAVLELGCGAGYDAFQICSQRADYVGLDIAPQNLVLTRKHLRLYGYDPILVRGDVENLPFPKERFDVLFSNGVLHHTADMEKSLSEACRVLKTGGELWMVVYHRDSVFYWIKLFLVDHLLRFGFRKRSLQDRLAMIEYTTGDERPLVRVYSRRQVRKMMSAARLNVKYLWVRKLLTEDLPDIPVLTRLWRFIPARWLRFFGKAFGWYVVAKAEKR